MIILYKELSVTSYASREPIKERVETATLMANDD
jgi:hypothetical protein